MAEYQAAQWVGYTLYGLAGFVLVNSAYGSFVVHHTTNTRESVWGIGVGLIAKIGMPVLVGWKLKVAACLGSKALRADAVEAIICGYLSVVLMIGFSVTPLQPGL
jgi:divalent metal cation (Fe/Co/Zn/Cd) transporter